ncbi:PREDICTED: putative protein MSS51 homolog, mitochondrial [Nipponia nippon]|uniref:putative protein MSS51 homolog, mitochondrial n=1 Tax=Nipponia nippon TaxID=128390 RepID=UPI000510E40A|nr:PREDICTED: putative protein MSS51 homolog, mitochondrial [Nipponia nippon]
MAAKGLRLPARPGDPAPSLTTATTGQRNAGAAPKTGRPKKPVEEPVARGPDVDSLGFQAMDRNVPGLSHVILQKLNMKCYKDYNPGDIPFPTDTWTKPARDVEGWEDWFSMQGQLEEKLGAILAGRYMTLLWANAGKPRPEDGELRESVWRLVTDFHSRPLTIGLGLRLFGIDPLAKALTVHVVGASHVETLNTRLTDYDELTRMFPGHRGMEVVMIGVDVVDGAIMRPPLAAPAPRGRVYLSSYKGLYHDFWESHVETKLAARPDLVVGFHPGFHACPDLLAGWLPPLLLLRDYRLPVLFTVYSEQELKSSLQILVELETHIMGYAANPFASLRPEQVYSSPNKAPVYCSSYYIALLGPVASAVPGAEELEDGDGWQGGEPSAAGTAGGIAPGLG